jgi:hypothetical protein
MGPRTEVTHSAMAPCAGVDELALARGVRNRPRAHRGPHRPHVRRLTVRTDPNDPHPGTCPQSTIDRGLPPAASRPARR